MKNDLPDLVLTVSVPLMCGCVLTQHIREPASYKMDPTYATKFFVYAANNLHHWYRTGAKEHQCELVTPKNPTGSKRIANNQVKK